MKKDIEPFDYAKDICDHLGHGGVLVTAKSGGTVNSMTIGWGMMGRVWNLPTVIIWIREGRFTRSLLDEAGDFTLNVPHGDTPTKILAFCGAKSGRDVNKPEHLGLTLVDSDLVKAPGIKELPLTLECRIMYRQLLDKNAVPEDIRTTMYPQDVPGTHPMANKDYHFVYYGQILKSYIIE